jgi:hypothetical protein
MTGLFIAAFCSCWAIRSSRFCASELSFCWTRRGERRIGSGWRRTQDRASWPAARPSNTSSTGAFLRVGITLSAIQKQPAMLSWRTLTNYASVAQSLSSKNNTASFQETIAEYQVKQKKKFVYVAKYFNVFVSRLLIVSILSTFVSILSIFPKRLQTDGFGLLRG